jgi:hypothetical protein
LPQELLEVLAQLPGRRIALGAIFLQALADDSLEFAGKGGVQLTRGSRCFVQDIVEESYGGRACEGRFARSHFIEHRAEGENVGTRIEGLTSSLFGRHVRRRADSEAGIGEGTFQQCGGIAGSGSFAKRWDQRCGFGQAEIEQLGLPALRHENISGFDVAMDDARRMCRVQCVG